MPRARRKSPRRQAKQERARETVDAVLEAAARVLEREGYARATTNRIAETAGVSVGSLYQYFADKDAVFDALVRRELEALIAALPADALDPALSLRVALRRVLAAVAGSQRHGPDLYRSLEQVPGALFRRRLAASRGRVVDFVQRLLEARRGRLAVRDPALAAFVLVSAAEGVALNARGVRFDERLAEELALLFERYLAA